MAGIQLRIEQQRSIAAASIGATYTAVGSAIANATQILMIQNFTDAAVQFSFDGSVDHFPLAAQTSMILDVCSDTVTNVSGLFVSAGTVIYVKQIGVPTTGSVYVTPMYSR